MPQEIAVPQKKKGGIIDSIASVINTGTSVLGGVNTISGVLDKFDTVKQFVEGAKNVQPDPVLDAVQAMAPQGSLPDTGASMLRRMKMYSQRERTA